MVCQKTGISTTVEYITNLSSPWPLTYLTPFPLHHIDYLILWQTLVTHCSCSWCNMNCVPMSLRSHSDSWWPPVYTLTTHVLLTLDRRFSGVVFYHIGCIFQMPNSTNWNSCRQKNSSLCSWEKVTIAWKVMYEILKISQNSTQKANCKTEIDLISQCK